jgi:murein L,D-transpeptidase YafK
VSRWAVLLLLAGTAAHADRVSDARRAKGDAVLALFARAGVAYPPAELYLRGFKAERELEVWAGPRGGPLKPITRYSVCAASGELGPKRRQGDLQVPEGFYVLDRFNPFSNFLLSLRVSYPNASDKVRGARGELGGDIYVHGSCVSIGCLAIEDAQIQELYLIAFDAQRAGGRAPVVHLFPGRLDPAGLKALSREHPAQAEFWAELAPAYQQFEATRRLPRVKIDGATGRYRVEPETLDGGRR